MKEIWLEVYEWMEGCGGGWEKDFDGGVDGWSCVVIEEES